MFALIGHSDEVQSVTISHHGYSLVISSAEARVAVRKQTVSGKEQGENSDYC